MLANYHTHTCRCHHAEGSEREYIETAIGCGMKLLGFSDHTAYDIRQPRPFRMAPEELPGYAGTLRALAAEYRDRIEIRIGVEAEYYPLYFPAHLTQLRDNGIDYMILGQHFLGNEIDEPYVARETDDVRILERYAEQSAEAMRTGLFTCFAHPDLIHFVGSRRIYDHHIGRLCEAAKETDTPLEINLLGIREGRHYPDERFWAIAGEVGNTVVLGCDAHRPQDVCGGDAEARALGMVKKYSLRRMDTVPLRRL